MIAQVAVAACRFEAGGPATELYPDEDWPLFERALGDLGLDPAHLSWDDPDVDWSSFDIVVVRSTWDSVDRPTEYLAWARQVAAVTNLENALAAIEWTLDKHYLADLLSAGVGIVPTEWVAPGQAWDPLSVEYVVKPSISAAGRDTARYQPGEEPRSRPHVERLHAAGHTAMIQPYVASVDDRGELKVVFIDGALSHAFRVGPLLEPGLAAPERPWEKEVWRRDEEPDALERSAAEAAMAAVADKLCGPTLYCRVDLVSGPANDQLVMEIELIDPALGFPAAPAGAGHLAAAVARRLSTG